MSVWVIREAGATRSTAGRWRGGNTVRDGLHDHGTHYSFRSKARMATRRLLSGTRLPAMSLSFTFAVLLICGVAALGLVLLIMLIGWLSARQPLGPTADHVVSSHQRSLASGSDTRRRG